MLSICGLEFKLCNTEDLFQSFIEARKYLIGQITDEALYRKCILCAGLRCSNTSYY